MTNVRDMSVEDLIALERRLSLELGSEEGREAELKVANQRDPNDMSILRTRADCATRLADLLRVLTDIHIDLIARDVRNLGDAPPSY